LKWTFLNVKRKKYDHLGNEEKKKIAKEVLWIEYFAKEIEAKNIISLGTEDYVNIKNEVMAKVQKDNTVKAAMVSRKTSSGLADIRKKLGYSKKDTD
jgi:hypothetical protein